MIFPSFPENNNDNNNFVKDISITEKWAGCNDIRKWLDIQVFSDKD